MRKTRRLDAVVAEQMGITRSQARGLIIAGRVRLGGTPATKAGTQVAAAAALDIAPSNRYVSRGGEKLAAALAAFAIDVNGLQALDVGASTGGFTDALLAHGAARVTALDVGYGQLAWKLRNDPRVLTIERTNFRRVDPRTFPDGFDLVTIDASFISLRALLPRAAECLRPDGALVALVKPQFEAGRERVGAGGVVRDPAVHRDVLRAALAAVAECGLVPIGLIRSPLRGPAGNVEFFVYARRNGAAAGEEEIDLVLAVPPDEMSDTGID